MQDKEIAEDTEIFTKKIMQNEGVTDYKIDIEGQPEVGVNYGSEIVFFSVTSKNPEKKYNFVMKTSRRSESLRKASEDGVLDINEGHMYSRVFPALRQMLADSKADYQLENISKTFLVNTEYKHETIIMEDLRANGFRLCDKQKPMSSEHIRMVLRYYGKYHASSMALRVKNPEVFNELTKDMGSIFRHFMHKEDMKQLFAGNVQDALDVISEAGLEDIIDKVKHIPGNVDKILSQDADEEDKVVITHGDCWINNIMVKYENSESMEPLELRFLDFQLSSFGSPALDLSYFLYASCDEDNLVNNFDQLLAYYYESLASTLKNLGLDPEKIFTYQDLKRHWRKYAKIGLVMGSTVMKLQLADKDESPELKSSGDAADWSSLRIGKIRKNDTYKSRIIAVYKNFTETCL